MQGRALVDAIKHIVELPLEVVYQIESYVTRFVPNWIRFPAMPELDPASEAFRIRGIRNPFQTGVRRPTLKQLYKRRSALNLIYG